MSEIERKVEVSKEVKEVVSFINLPSAKNTHLWEYFAIK